MVFGLIDDKYIHLPLQDSSHIISVHLPKERCKHNAIDLVYQNVV